MHLGTNEIHERNGESDLTENEEKSNRVFPFNSIGLGAQFHVAPGIGGVPGLQQFQDRDDRYNETHGQGDEGEKPPTFVKRLGEVQNCCAHESLQ